jgi:hypothetical protein
MKNGAIDWRSGEPASVTTYFDESMDIHHIFPRAWCEKMHIADSVYNSIINKTPLTARSNRVIGGWAPSEYMNRLSNSAAVPSDVIAKNIRTHLANPDLLVSDDFSGFMSARRTALLKIIGDAMGKILENTDGVQEDVFEPSSSIEDLQDDSAP